VAQAIRDCADELDTAITEWQLEALTLEQATRESGYSYGGLQRLVAEGKLENVGEEGSPRVRRADLPRKPRALSNGQPDPIGEILAKRTATRR
jgi:hypothetical protein